MDIFTMVIAICISGEPKCSQARVSQMDFTTEAVCESHIGDITHQMTKKFALDPALKGKQVSYDVSCMSQAQLASKYGTTQSDT